MNQPEENLDVEQTDTGWTVAVALPGVALEDIGVEVSQNELHIGTPVTDGSATSGFRYRLALPADAASEAVETTMKDGLLTVFLPRRTPKVSPPADPKADLQEVGEVGEHQTLPPDGRR